MCLCLLQRMARPQRLVGRLLSTTKPPSATRRSRLVRRAAVVAVAAAGVAGVTAARYFKYELEDLRRLVGLGTDDLTAAERRELAELEFVSEAVENITPHNFVHPFQQRSLLWRIGFVLWRSVFLAVTFLPVMVLSLRLYLDKENGPLRERWLLALRRALERSGTSMIKFGQWMSMRPDHFPPDLCACLAHLRDQVPAHAFEHTRTVIRQSFGCELEDIFEDFASEPVASGSVAQVYHARLKEDYALATGKTEVAVKVRHPQVVAETFVDLSFIFNMIPTMLMALDLNVKLPFDQDEFTLLLQQQVDLRWEALNLCRFAHNFSRETSHSGPVALRFPRVSPKVLSETVLVETWAQGVSIDNEFSEADEAPPPARWYHRLPGLGPAKSLHHLLADAIFDMYMKMFLRDNFTHGDLHAANVLFDRQSGVLTIIDAGIATSISEKAWYPFGDFIRAFCVGDEHAMAVNLVKFAGKHVRPQDKPHLVTVIEADLIERLKPWRALGYPAKPGHPSDVPGGMVLNTVMETILHNNLVLRGDVAASILTMSLAETLILNLNPKFDILTNSLPYFVRYQGWASTEAVWRSGYSRVSETPSVVMDAATEAAPSVVTAASIEAADKQSS